MACKPQPSQAKDHAVHSGAVEVHSSPEPAPRKCEADADNADSDDFDIDLEYDSDLEALLNELTQPQQEPKGRDANPASSSTAVDWPDDASSQSAAASQRRRPLSSQKFASSQDPERRRALSDRPRFKLARPQTGSDASGEGQLWWQQYEPATVAELSVHSAKIAQVRGWLELAAEAAAGRGSHGADYFRILVVEGPAGSCKSTCVRVLARELGLDILEWINPLSGRISEAGQLAEDGVGVVRRFEEFLMQAERYSSLALQPSTGAAVDASPQCGKLILVDDIPNIGHRDTRESFRAALMRFIAIPARRSFPMVVVVTESFATQQVLEDDGARRAVRRLREHDTGSHSDISVWSATDVLPSAVYNSAFCQTIRFNAVAPTIVAKGLRRILQIRSGQGTSARGAKFTPASTAAIKAIAEECQGDLRLAVTKLQLALAGGEVAAGEASGPAADRKRRRRGGGAQAVDVGGLAAMDVGEARRSALDTFHALGKVLYAKRGPALNGSARGQLESDPDEVLDRLPMDIGTFELYVHENYPDFCSHIGEAAEAAGGFSDADAVASSGRGGAGTGAADLYGAMMSVRGYMHARDRLPVADAAGPTPGESRRRAMATFRKPAFFENYRQRMANSRLLRDEACAGVLRLDGLRLADSGLVPDALPYWARIAIGRGTLQGSGARLQLARLATPGGAADALPQRLAAATVHGGPPLAPPPPPPQQQALAEDDIQDFSD